MADDIKLVIGVKYDGLLSAIKATDSLEGKVKKLSSAYSSGRASYSSYRRAVIKLAEEQNKGAKAQDKAKKELLEYGTALRRATKEEKAAKAAKEALRISEKQRLAVLKQQQTLAAQQAATDARNVAELRRLRMSTDAVYAADQRRLQMKRMLRAAVQAETMTTQEAIAALRQYNDVQRQSNGVMGNSRNRMNGMNMAVQQMGYQFGDFAVQVQGGTSAFVAFSQQGAQLAGILPMIAGPLGMSMKMAVGLSAALGILIPIGSAVARMYFDMKDKTKDAAEEAQTLNGKLKGLNGTLSDYANTLAAIDAGVSINELFASRGIKAAEQELKDATATLEKYVGFVNLALEGKAIGTMGPVAAVGALVGIGFATLSKEQEAAAIEKVRKAEETLTELRAMETANKLKAHTAAVSGMQNELELARVIARHGKDSSEAKAAALAQELRLRLESVQAQVTLNNYTQPEADDLKAQIREVAALLAAGTKAAETGQQKALRLSQDDLEIQRLKNDILRSHNAEGEKTRATLTLEAHLAGEIVRIKQEQKFLEGGITAAEQAQIDNLVAAAIGAEHLNQKIEAGVDSAKELADALSQAASAMGQLVNFGSGLDKALSVAVAQTKALQAGQNAANAGRIAGMRFDAQSKFNTAMEAAGPLGDSTLTNAASKEFRQQNLTIDGIANSLNTNAGLKDAEKEANKKPKKTVDEYLEELRKEQAHKSSLVGLSKEAIKQSEFEFKLRNKISTLEGETSEAKVIAVLREQEALEKAAEKQKERMQQEQTYSSILANSLESVVQGTLSVEDAFKSMLRNIVMEIYKTNIVEPFADKGASLITSLISSAFGGGPQVGAPTSSLRPKVRSADGNVFTKVNAYASGGVVSSPTTFPMSGGQTGLMGEAGAEAIMPLKRGRNGKLGVQAEGSSGDVININQSFNFQSNGDDTIKSLIAQAAPKIAQMTKASMLDDRRRGGRTKAAFG